MIRVSLLAKVGRLGKYHQISSVFQCLINTFLVVLEKVPSEGS